MQHQTHEPFFSFTVPPKISLPLYPPNQHLLHQLPSRSPILTRSNPADRFAFNLSDDSSSLIPPLSPNQLSTPSSSSLDRPYSSSGLPASAHLPQTVSNSQTFGSCHATNPHQVLKPSACSSLPNLAPQSALLTPAHTSNYPNGTHQIRPMTGNSINRLPLESPSGCSSDPELRFQGSISGEPLDCSTDPNSPQRCGSGPDRPSFGTRSSSSSPQSLQSPDGDLPHPHNYLDSMPYNQFHNVLRPSTHSGTSHSFGDFHAQPLLPRPATGYVHLSKLHSGFAPAHSQYHQYGPRPSVYAGQSPQIYSPSSGYYSHGPEFEPLKSSSKLYNLNVLPGAPRKRARRRFDEVERLYSCIYPGCTKAYGTLNHLNAHISMQKHGSKRLPQEFKEVRKEWRARKKEAEARAAAMKQSPPHVTSGYEYSVLGGPDVVSRHHAGLSTSSSPTQISKCQAFGHVPSPAFAGSFSAPAHSQHFTNLDGKNDWSHEYRIHPDRIDEGLEYTASASPHLSGSFLPNQSFVSPPRPAPSNDDSLRTSHPQPFLNTSN